MVHESALSGTLVISENYYTSLQNSYKNKLQHRSARERTYVYVLFMWYYGWVSIAPS